MPDLASPPTTDAYYVYGVIRSESGLPADLTGLDDSPLELVELDEVAAVVGRIALERPPGRRADLMAHTRVLDQLATRAAVVPAQFGSVLTTRESVLENLLVGRTRRFAPLLEFLAGRAQYLLRATYREEQVLAEVVREDSTIAALRKRTQHLDPGLPHPELMRLGELVAAALERKRTHDGNVLLAQMADLVVEHATRPGTGVDQLLDVALLVDLDAAAALDARLEELAADMHDRVRLRLTGPMAPYDFAEDRPWG